MSEKPTCATCRFCIGLFGAAVSPDETTGMCVRRAPTPAINTFAAVNAVWPSVSVTSWCGEYEARAHEQADQKG